MIKHHFLLLGTLLFLVTQVQAQEDEKKKFRIGKNPDERADKIVANILEAIDGMDDPETGIPMALARKSGGIIIFPKALKTSIGVGSQSGQGMALIRKGNGWSNPYYVKLQEASAGLQFGVQVSEIIMLVKDPEFIRDLEKADMEFGADVNATAGPDSESIAADFDPEFDADIYTYQKAKGLFGGASLSGGALIFSWKLNQAEYGEDTSVDKIFNSKVPYNQDVKTVINALKAMGI